MVKHLDHIAGVCQPSAMAAGSTTRAAQDDRPVVQTLENRRSCVGFRPSLVTLDEICSMAVVAGLTPSEMDLQPWRIHVAQGEALDRVCSALLESNVPKARAAGTALVLSGDTATVDDSPVAARFYENRSRRDFVLRNVSMYLMAFMLVAESRGLATRPMAGFDEDVLSAVCGFAPTQFPVAVLLVGQSDGRRPEQRGPRLDPAVMVLRLDDGARR